MTLEQIRTDWNADLLVFFDVYSEVLIKCSFAGQLLMEYTEMHATGLRVYLWTTTTLYNLLCCWSRLEWSPGCDASDASGLLCSISL